MTPKQVALTEDLVQASMTLAIDIVRDLAKMALQKNMNLSAREFIKLLDKYEVEAAKRKTTTN